MVIASKGLRVGMASLLFMKRPQKPNTIGCLFMENKLKIFISKINEDVVVQSIKRCFLEGAFVASL